MRIGNLPGTMENAQFSAEMLPLGLIIAPNDIFVNFLNSFLFLGFFSSAVLEVVLKFVTSW